MTRSSIPQAAGRPPPLVTAYGAPPPGSHTGDLGVQPLEVYVDRWAPCVRQQDSYAALAARSLASGAHIHSPLPGLPGYSRAWIVFRDTGDGPAWTATNGHFTVCSAGTDPGRPRARLTELLDAGETLPLRVAPHLAQDAARPIVDGRLDVVETLRYLSIWTSAALTLDHLAHVEVGRLRLKDRAGQWLACLGESAFIAIRPYEQRRGPTLRKIYVSATSAERALAIDYWRTTVRPTIAEVERSDHPLAPHLKALESFTDERDEGEIRAEVAARVRSVAITSVAVGAVGGSLVPNFIAGGTAVGLLVAGLVVAAWLALAIALFVRDVVDETRALKAIARAEADRPQTNSPGLSSAVRAVRTQSTEVVVGPRMGAVDFAAAATLWMELLGDHDATLSDGSTAPAAHGSPGSTARVIVGGPLVRARVGSRAACDLALTDATYRQWAYATDDRVLVPAGEDDSIGCVSCAVGDDATLFVTGFRDARLAVRWLLESLADPVGGGAAPWELLHSRRSTSPADAPEHSDPPSRPTRGGGRMTRRPRHTRRRVRRPGLRRLRRERGARPTSPGGIDGPRATDAPGRGRVSP